jgi:hypothetical protein
VAKTNCKCKYNLFSLYILEDEATTMPCIYTTDTDSTASTDSAASLGKVGFLTLDAQAYFSYDLNFAGKPEEWTCRNMLSDCVLQGPDSNKRTIVEILSIQHPHQPPDGFCGFHL